MTARALIPILALVALTFAACSSAGGASTTAPTGTPATGTPGSGAPPCPTTSTPTDLGPWNPPTTTPSVIPQIVTGQLVCGTNRVVFSFLDPKNNPIAAPDRTATVAFYDLGRDPSKVVATKTGTFIWAIDNERGVYVTSMDFPDAGIWGAEFTTAKAGGSPTTVRLTFQVVPTGSALRVGAKAPASKTPTVASMGGDVARVSTDQHPDKRFYLASVSDVVGKKPFVLVFATPKFCTSGQCGPTLDRVKPLLDEFPTVTFINVEPYQLAWKGDQLQPVLDGSGQLQPVPAVDEWGIYSEPWIFVVDRTGTITGSFEGVVGTDELRQAVAAVK